jgi:ABC-type transport system involved in multi-copper enzyme maturation permease subunit
MYINLFSKNTVKHSCCHPASSGLPSSTLFVVPLLNILFIPVKTVDVFNGDYSEKMLKFDA